MDTCRVILVDDDNDEAVFLKEALEATDRIVLQAICCDYEELMSVLDTSDLPDLIICDIQMPRKSGIEISEELQNIEKLRGIPILLISGIQPSPSVMNQANKSHIKSILIKPFSSTGFRKLADKLVDVCEGAQIPDKVLFFE